MKRKALPILALALALTFLAACGTDTPVSLATPGASPEQTAQPTPEPSPSSTPEIQGVPVEFHLPDPGFEADSYWLAEPYGDEGQALMLTATDEDGVTQLKCWYDVHNIEQSGGREDRNLVCNSYSAADYTGGNFAVLEDSSASASVSIGGDTLSVTYSGLAETDPELPTSFRRVSEDEALDALRDMPYNDEVKLAVETVMSREDFEALPGLEKLDDETYKYNGMVLGVGAESFSSVRINSVTGTDIDTAPDVRGVKIGSSARDLLACFPGDVKDVDMDGEDVHLYSSGDGMRTSGGDIVHTDDGKVLIVFSDFESQVVFTLDSDGLVESISWSDLFGIRP